jgi:hypothetical protein
MGGRAGRARFAGDGKKDGLFYFGGTGETPSGYREMLRVYDRAGHPCIRCGTPVKRIFQAVRSTFYCPKCLLSEVSEVTGPKSI